MSVRYSLYENPFRKNEYMATVRPRYIYTLKDLARRMEHFYGRKFAYGELETFFTCFSEEIERILKEGSSLHFPFMKIDLSMSGKFKDKNDRFDPRRHKLKVKLNPDKQLNALVRGLKTQKVSPSNPGPVIKEVHDLVQDCKDSGLTIGHPVQLHGKHLKLDEGDPLQGVFLIGDKGKTFPVTKVFLNTHSRLFFFVPEEMKPGMYRLEVRAKVGNSTQLRTAYFPDPLTVSKLS